MNSSEDSGEIRACAQQGHSLKEMGVCLETTPRILGRVQCRVRHLNPRSCSLSWQNNPNQTAHQCLFNWRLFHQPRSQLREQVSNDIEAPKALDVQLGGLHIEPSEANFVLAAILNGGRMDYHQY